MVSRRFGSGGLFEVGIQASPQGIYARHDLVVWYGDILRVEGLEGGLLPNQLRDNF